MHQIRLRIPEHHVRAFNSMCYVNSIMQIEKASGLACLSILCSSLSYCVIETIIILGSSIFAEPKVWGLSYHYVYLGMTYNTFFTYTRMSHVILNNPLLLI